MKNILITGACGGMGRATAKFFADKGFRVFALDKKPCEAKENTVFIETDITSEESVTSAYERVKSEADELYAVLHFAGIYMLDSLVEMNPEEFRRIFDVNLYGAYLVNKTFLPLLKNGSRILITTSELAPLDPLPYTGIYAVTKGALDKYAYSLCMELQLLGISVSVLRAGAVDTGMLSASTDALEHFCAGTELYTCNAERFKAIVERVEARCVPPERIAEKAYRIINKKRTSFAYKINRNPLLLLLNMLPKRVQLFAIGTILKK